MLSRLATSNFQAGDYFRQQCNLLQKFLVCANGTWCFLLSSSPLFSAEYGRTFFTILPPFLSAALALSFICLGNIERGVFFLVSTVFLQFELFASYSHYFSFPATFVLIIFARCSVDFRPWLSTRALLLCIVLPRMCPVLLNASATIAIVHCVHVRRAKSSQPGSTSVQFFTNMHNEILGRAVCCFWGGAARGSPQPFHLL